jgi:hypothetical protein
VVSGGRLLEIGADGSLFDRGAVGIGPAQISGNGGIVTVVCDGDYYTWDGTTLDTPPTGAFTDFGGVEYLGGYTILTEANGQRFQWSAIADPSDLPGLNFATAESVDDVLLRPVAIAGNLWLFGERSIEVWGRTGGSGADAFALIPGQVIEKGLRSAALLTKVPNGAFFVGNDGVVYLTGGTQINPISTPAIHAALRQGEPTSCFYYEDEGHKFCVVRFRDRPAWVFDLATQAWHERATGELGPWGAEGAAQAHGRWYVGGYGGQVRILSRNNTDAGAEIIRSAVSKNLRAEGLHARRVMSAEFFGRVGFADIGRALAMQMRVSRDGGMTWGSWRTASMGTQGQRERRMVFRNLGLSRQLCAEVRVSEPADCTLHSSADVVIA